MTIELHNMTVRTDPDATEMIADWRDTDSDATGFASVTVPTSAEEAPRWEVGTHGVYFETLQGSTRAHAPAHWDDMKTVIQDALDDYAHFHVLTPDADTHGFEPCESISDVRDVARANGWTFISESGVTGSPFMHVSEYYGKEWYAAQHARFGEVATLYCLDELHGDTWCVVAR